MTGAPQEGFYVTIRRATKTGFLLGPYPAEEGARTNVDRARDAAVEVDEWAWFDSFGTARVTLGPGRVLPPGLLNARIGLEAAPAE